MSVISGVNAYNMKSKDKVIDSLNVRQLGLMGHILLACYSYLFCLALLRLLF